MTHSASGVVQQPLDSATVQPGPVTLTFQNVLAAGFATLVMPTTGPAPPNGYQHGTPARYYDLMTTSLYSGSIKVCIDYAGIAFANEATLRLFHHSSTGWEDKTSSLDMSTKTICAAVTSLSPFAIFEQAPPDTTPPTITPRSRARSAPTAGTRVTSSSPGRWPSPTRRQRSARRAALIKPSRATSRQPATPAKPRATEAPRHP